MIHWPDDVPADVLVEGFRAQQEENRVVFKTEVGPPKMRRRTTARSMLYDVTTPPLTHQQMERLRTWYEEDIADGTMVFEHPRDPLIKDVFRAVFETPIIFTPFGYSAHDSDMWKATFTLRRLP